MPLNRVQIAVAAAVLVVGGVWMFGSARAQAPRVVLAGIPCRVSWEDTTRGGDWSTSQGEVELTQIAPQGDGSFVAIGNGHATITYHSANGCQIFGSPWSAPYMVTVQSDNGQTAEVDVTPMDEPHSVVACPNTAAFQFDVDAPGLPTVTVPLHEGATPFSEDHSSDHGHAGDAGTVTLHYCTLPQH